LGLVGKSPEPASTSVFGVHKGVPNQKTHFYKTSYHKDKTHILNEQIQSSNSFPLAGPLQGSALFFLIYF
jgi:hypothetical protein